MVNKATLTKQEAEALKSALEINGGDAASVVHWHAQNLWDGTREVLNDLDLDTIIRATYIGYELEPSSEEKLKTYFQDVMNDSHAMGQRVGILNTLQLLNIKIPGVNC